MKIAAAQIKPIDKNIEANIQNHLGMIELAAQQKVELILFPEITDRHDFFKLVITL